MAGLPEQTRDWSTKQLRLARGALGEGGLPAPPEVPSVDRALKVRWQWLQNFL